MTLAVQTVFMFTLIMEDAQIMGTSGKCDNVKQQGVLCSQKNGAFFGGEGHLGR